MKKPSTKLGIYISAALIAASAAYAFAQSHPDDGTAPIVASLKTATPPNPTPNQTAPVQNTPAKTAPPPSSTGMGMMRGMYANGTYTGSAADAYYGTVQVQAVVRGGKLADVQFLQYPNDRSTSIYINSQAMPMLTQEAIQVQSANVDIISGATATSGAFIQSLGSALSQARA